MRGTGMFLIVVGPCLVGMWLGLLLFRRRRHIAIGVLTMIAGFLVSWGMRDLNVHDGDMPTFRGFLWGRRVLPWLLIPAWLGSVWAFAAPPKKAVRGFRVEPNDVGS
jgi:hypothetical protein